MVVSDGELSTLQGRYAIEREIGEGGMATVYLAKEQTPEKAYSLNAEPDRAEPGVRPEGHPVDRRGGRTSSWRNSSYTAMQERCSCSAA